MFRVGFLVCICMLFSSTCKSQNDLLNEDFSEFWTTDKIRLTNGETVSKPSPIGYFGSNYYRFKIRFLSVIQNPYNKKQYLVYGKNKLKENVSEFQGFIEIDSVTMYDSPNKPGIEEGVIYANYTFYEDSRKEETGKFEGICQTFIQRSGDKIEYNTVAFLADGFRNNQFEGHWINYKSGTVRVCNWGDYRIPNSKELDVGAGEFHANLKYLSNGWQVYEHANHPFPYTEEQKEAKRIGLEKEKEKWWEQ